MTIQITRAKPDDLEALLHLMRELQLADPWKQPFDDEPVLRKDLMTLLGVPVYGVAYLARDGPVPVGYLSSALNSLEYRGKGAWVDELFVAVTSRGQGIGTRLLDLAESAAREHGAQALHLEVNHDNPAIELYRRRGFTEHHRILMTKNLF